MNETNNSVTFDGWLFSVNTNKFPRDELAKYSGRFVAWSTDGKRILASGEDYEEVDRNLKTAGIEPSQVVHDYVEPLDGSSVS
jgi:hypothetical protein